jgi:hypothetical protein
MDTALKGEDPQLYPQYYVPYAEQMQNALTRAKPLNKLAERAPDAVEDYLRSSGRARDSVRYMPMVAARHNATVMLDASSEAVLDILLVDLWQSRTFSKHARQP